MAHARRQNDIAGRDGLDFFPVRGMHGKEPGRAFVLVAGGVAHLLPG
jgi:hypothetical protein